MEEKHFLYNLYEKVKNYGDKAVFSGIKPSPGVCSKFKGLLNKPEATLTETFIKEVFKDELRLEPNKAKARARTYDNLIRLLSYWQETPLLALLLARLCYERALLIMQKAYGKSKKKESLLKQALNILDKILKHSDYPEALELKALVYLELKYMDVSPSDFSDILRPAFEKKKDCDAKITLALAEAGNGEALTCLSSKTIPSNYNYLDRTRIAILENHRSLAKKWLNEALSKEVPFVFSSPWWDELIEVLNKLPPNLKFTFSTKAFEKIYTLERSFKIHNLHLLWYWSKLKDIYEMAFIESISQKEYLKALFIADALKGRVMIKWHLMEKVLGEEFSDILEKEILGRLGYFVKSLEKKQKPSSTTWSWPNLNEYFFDFIPPDFAVVHLFFTEKQFENQGYAFILQKDNNVELKSFNIEKIWNYFLQFKNAYLFADKYPVSTASFSSAVKSLLEILGEELSFLFDKIVCKYVLFIPYGFLHQLPLHAMKHEEKGYFFEKYLTAYFPAWSFVYTISPEENASKQIVMLKYFDRHKFSKLKNAFRSFSIKDPASKEDFLNLTSPLNTLVIVSHGEANLVNSFESTLKLNPPLTLKEILEHKNNAFRGSKVLLIGCETDLEVPPKKIVDEYISLSTIFLLKGAKEVIGTLWEVYADTAEEAFLKLLHTNGKESLEKYQQYLLQVLSEGEIQIEEYIPLRIHLHPKSYL